jgi:hypothetical protein
MTENLLRGLSPKDELDDSSLLRTLLDSLPEHVYVKDTESRYVLNNVTHVRSSGGFKPGGDRWRVGLRLLSRGGRYRAVVEQSVEGIYMFDHETRELLESNTALKKVLG